jgi:hypothetical protein
LIIAGVEFQLVKIFISCTIKYEFVHTLVCVWLVAQVKFVGKHFLSRG